MSAPHVTTSHRLVAPGPTASTVRGENDDVLTPPEDWEFLPAGDGPLTREVKKRGGCWQVQVRRGRRTIAKGIWASAADIAAARRQVEARRASPAHARRLATDRNRRNRRQQEYVTEFYQATLAFLNFHPVHRDTAARLARAVTELATPVGSGTVARTARIGLEERVRSAVIAWLRHQTTDYDRMAIARVKGRRREVRRQLAGASLELLARYRSGGSIPDDCPLQLALAKAAASSSSSS